MRVTSSIGYVLIGMLIVIADASAGAGIGDYLARNKLESELTACRNAMAKPASATRVASSAESQARQAVREALKDPDSARFGKFSRVGSSACLTVNSRNAFGGYTGDQQAVLFYDSASKRWLLLAVMDKLTHEMCVAAARDNQ